MGESSRLEWMKDHLEAYDGGVLKLAPEGRRKKYKQMSVSPYTFYRGSAYLFFQDFLNQSFAKEGAEQPTWVQGDLHFENFGSFHNAKGEIVFDSNDFDEAYIGSYLLDISRMAVSIVLVGELLGYSKEEMKETLHTYLKAYYKQMKRYQKRKEDPVTSQFTSENTKKPIRIMLEKLEKKRSRKTLLERFAQLTPDGWTLKRNEELEAVEEEIKQKILRNWEEYIHSLPKESRFATHHYKIKDIAHKRNSGTGSLGLDRFYLLVEGEEQDIESKDDIILEMKESRYSVLDAVMPTHEEFHEFFPQPGQQVVVSQRAMHHEPDPFLGIISIDQKHYYVRERSPYKRKLKVEQITTLKQFNNTLEVMGKLTAKLHARADADLEAAFISYHSEDVIVKSIEKDKDSWFTEMTMFAINYAKQVHIDYAYFLQVKEELEASQVAP